MRNFVAEQVAAGKTDQKYQDWYDGRVTSTREMIKSLDRLTSTVEVPEEDLEELTKLVDSIPQLIRDIRKFKKNLRDFRDLYDELKPYSVQLKELLLDRQIEAYESAIEKISNLADTAESATSLTQISLAKVKQFEETSAQLTQANSESTKIIGRLATTAQRRKEKIEESKAQAEQELSLLKQVEIDADTSRRSIKAVEGQLEGLASSTTDHIAKMRKTEDDIRIAVEANTKQKDDYLAELRSIKDQADEVLRNAAAGALYGAYDVRKNALAEKVEATKNAICWTTGGAVLSAAIVWALSAYFKWPVTEQWVAKIGVLSPFGLLAWFLLAQYNRERILEEEYASKASMSNSYPAFRDDLIRLTREGDDATKRQAVTAAIEMSKEIFTDPLRILKIGPETKEKDSKAPEKTSASDRSTTPDDIATEIAKKVGGVLQATTDLIEKASKLTKVGD